MPLDYTLPTFAEAYVTMSSVPYLNVQIQGSQDLDLYPGFSTHLPGHVHSPLPAPFHLLPRLQWIPEGSQVPVQPRPVLDHQLQLHLNP